MNKKFVLIFFLSIFTFLHSAILLDYYQRDYQVANRSVLVFNGKPELKTSQNGNHLIIEVQDCQKDYDVKSLETPKNHLLNAITYSLNDNDLIIDFDLRNFGKEIPVYDKMEFAENKNKYKVVIDFIKTRSPQNEEDAIAIAKFYKSTGRSKKAENILTAFKEKKIETPKQNKKDTIEEKKVEIPKQDKKGTLEVQEQKQIAKPVNTQPAQPMQKQNPKPNFLSIFQVFPLYFYIAIFLGIVVIILLIRILSRKKKITSVSSNENQFSTSGFGSEKMQIIAVNKLAEYGWTHENIAKELYITQQRVKELLKETKKNTSQ